MTQTRPCRPFDGSKLLPLLLLLFLARLGPAMPPVPEESLSLQELINLPAEDLAQVDIATMNLAAAEGLPGSEQIDRAAVCDTIDAWARRVAAVTESKAHLFESNPSYYDNSWAKYCTVILVLTLQQELGVHYNFEQRTNPSLAKSKDQFIHGIVEGTGGTCASLPVVFVAVGRRLGYPLKLAQGFSHFYARWDDPRTGERFNIEGSNPGGVDFHDDDHYRDRARKKGVGPLEAGNYLQSMSPREELSSFLTTRADCLRENGHVPEAYRMYQQAVDLAPENLFAAWLLEKTERTFRRVHAAQSAEAAYRRHEQRRRTDPRLMIPGMPAIPGARPASIRSPGNGLPDSFQPFPSPVGTGVPTSWSPPSPFPPAAWSEPPPLPQALSQHPASDAASAAVSGTRHLPVFGLPVPTSQSSPPATVYGWDRDLRPTNLDGTGWRPTSMQDYVNEQNRRNEALIQQFTPYLHRRPGGSVPPAPTPSTLRQETRP